mmetsp:Transcript_24165/g.39449  ORF Transcript_24165/g.39449 Transcript_24165/m.39449 type:complete len:366 (+) Transcript_24165:282-1379(+)
MRVPSKNKLKSIVVLLFAVAPCLSFVQRVLTSGRRKAIESSRIVVLNEIESLSGTETDSTSSATKESQEEFTPDDGPRKSFWKPKWKESWVERENINDLTVGQKLYGHVVEELLDGKTGPKLFFECGVGRIDKKGNWHIVNGMLRIGRGKASVTRKRAARYRKKDRVPLYVSRVQKECCRLEVCLSPEDAKRYIQQPPKVSVTSLRPTQEVEGTILKVYPYGAIVDVGANRRGLLHITKVASLYGKYINKEQGLKEAGIEKGAKVRLSVESVQNRRLVLDFTPDVKEEADREFKRASSKSQQDSSSEEIPGEDLQEWAEYANQQESLALEESEDEDDNDDEDEDYDDDEYDEDGDIEEALGLDTY